MFAAIYIDGNTPITIMIKEEEEEEEEDEEEGEEKKKEEDEEEHFMFYFKESNTWSPISTAESANRPFNSGLRTSIVGVTRGGV